MILGEGQVTANVHGWVEKDGTYEMTFEFQISDAFEGVLSGGIPWGIDKITPDSYVDRNAIKKIEDMMDFIESTYGNLEFPYCTPYNMTASWEITIEGRFE